MAEFDVFAEIIQTYGEPTFAERMALKIADAYRGKVPDALVRFWQEHGTGSYGNAQFWICEPLLLAPVIQAIFKGDVKFRPTEIFTIGYNAFGNLSCWLPTGEMLYPNFDEQTIFEADRDRDRPTRPELANLPRATPNFAVGIAILNGIDSEDDGPYDVVDGEPLFPQALARLGPLAPGEIYGFAPALNFGGEARVENVRRVGVVEHLLFLSQASTFKLVRLDPATPTQPFGVSRTVRTIGRAER